jgi:thiamine monophosphate synthase
MQKNTFLNFTMLKVHGLPAPLREAFTERRALKIIAGLNNFDGASVKQIVQAAHQGGATFVDIAADRGLVQLAKEHTNLPICVSAVELNQFLEAVEAGADLLEIGNYDCFYRVGKQFSLLQVLELTRSVRQRLPHIPLSVTVPHTLDLSEQVKLAEELVNLGANIIQTEGGTSASPAHSGVLGLMEKAVPTLAAAYEISRAVNIPVLCSSGITDVTAPLAITCGAAGVGVCSAIRWLQNGVAMVAAVRALKEALEKNHPRVEAPITELSI